ncbi:MAG: FKBP-type peptidyl-prolyl cis-trans isomerase [Ekhidna sp.]
MKKNILISFISILVFSTSCSKDDSLTSVTFEKQLEIDITRIEEYLDANNIEAEIHDSGIRFVTIQEGSGRNPISSNNVEVKYKGTLLNGTVFDENADGITFPLSSLISAWQIMIPEMNEGGKMTIYAPSVYCYGPRSQGSIPAFSSLIFEIELVSIN